MYFVCICCISGSVGAFVDDRVVICGGYTMQDQEYLAGCQKQTGRKENGELEVRRHWLKSCTKYSVRIFLSLISAMGKHRKFKPKACICIEHNVRNWVQQYHFIFFGRLSKRCRIFEFCWKVWQKCRDIWTCDEYGDAGEEVAFLHTFGEGRFNTLKPSLKVMTFTNTTSIFFFWKVPLEKKKCFSVIQFNWTASFCKNFCGNCRFFSGDEFTVHKWIPTDYA